MKELLKRLNALLAKGIATKSEKDAIKKELEALDTDEQEIVADKVEAVNGLPEEEKDEEVEKILSKYFSQTKSELSAELKKELEAYIKEQKDLADKKAGLFAKDVKDNRAVANAKFKSTFMALINNDETALKEMTTDATGSPYTGYNVDSELSAEIRHLMTEYGVARREMTAIPLVKNEYKANSLAVDPYLFWVDEGGVIKSTEVVLGQDSLKLKKLGAIVALTRELIEDGEIDLFGFIAGRLAEGFAKYEDRAFFTGAGSLDSDNGGFTGLLNDSNINEYVMDATSIESITPEDLNKVIDKTPSGALTGSKWYLNRTIKSILRVMKDGDGRYLYQPLSTMGPESLNGYPIVDVEVMPTRDDDDADTSFILFGNLKRACIFGYKSGIEAKRFDAGSIRNVADNADINLITTDREAIRWVERVGYFTVLPTALTKLTTGSVSE